MLRWVAVLGLALASIGLVPGTGASQTRVATETTLHAIFTYNFAKFAQWTGTRATSGPLTFCVLDAQGVEDALEELIRGRPIQGRDVAMVRGIDLARVSLCHVLYVSEDTAEDGDLLAAASRAAVLTVGSGREFAEGGGVIGLYVEDGHMRFAVNLALARRSGIGLGSQMLSLATIVGNE